MRIDTLDMAEAAVPEEPRIMFFARIVKIHSSKWEEGGKNGPMNHLRDDQEMLQDVL